MESHEIQKNDCREILKALLSINWLVRPMIHTALRGLSFDRNFFEWVNKIDRIRTVAEKRPVNKSGKFFTPVKLTLNEVVYHLRQISPDEEPHVETTSLGSLALLLSVFSFRASSTTVNC